MCGNKNGKFSVIMYLVFIPILEAIKSMGVRLGEANFPTLTEVRMMTWGTRWCTFLFRKAWWESGLPYFFMDEL